MRTAQALFRRDREQIAAFYALHGSTKKVEDVLPTGKCLDNAGAWHPHVEFQRACKFEPYIGRTARAARMVGASPAAKKIGLRERLALMRPWYVLKSTVDADSCMKLDGTAEQFYARLVSDHSPHFL
eukprot:1542560-Karenia_brevis.AAC.1